MNGFIFDIQGEAQISARKQMERELQKKRAELACFRKRAVGRELKIDHTANQAHELDEQKQSDAMGIKPIIKYELSALDIRAQQVKLNQLYLLLDGSDLEAAPTFLLKKTFSKQLFRI